MTSVPRGTEPDGMVDDASELALSLHDPERFGLVFDRYFADIHSYAAKRVGRDAADDVAAETFLTAFRSRDRFDASLGTVRAWLYGIATNHLSAHRRREVRGYRALAAATASDAADPAEEGMAERVVARVHARAVHRDIAAALADLHRGDRDVLLLTALAGLTHAEIATALGIPYGTVGSRLNRARRKLRALPGITSQIEREA